MVIAAMSYIHKYSLTEIENLIPFERDILIRYIADYQELENKRNAGEK